MEDANEDIAANGGEDGGSGGEDAATAPADSKSPFLLGGFALLSVGGYTNLRFTRS